MTKQERIDRLERLVAELSYRVWDLERNRNYRYYPTYVSDFNPVQPLTFYSSTGKFTNLGTFSATNTATDTGNAES